MAGLWVRSLHLDSLEDVHRPFVTHPLQDDTQSDENTSPPHTSTTGTKEKIRL